MGMNSLPNSSPTMPTFRGAIWVLFVVVVKARPARGRAPAAPVSGSARGALGRLALEQLAQERERHARVLVDLDAPLVEAGLHREPVDVADVQQDLNPPVEVAVARARRRMDVVGDVDV